MHSQGQSSAEQGNALWLLNLYLTCGLDKDSFEVSVCFHQHQCFF